MANTFDQLPDEVLVLICQNFAVRATRLHRDPYTELRPIRKNWRALASLCRACKRLRRIAEPLLYQNYAKPDTVLDPSMHLQFRGFLRTILMRPELAQCLRYLHVGAWPHEGSKESFYCEMQRYESDGDAELIPPGDELMSLYLSQTHSTNLKGHHRQDWVILLEMGEEDAEITLLLSLATNIEHLEIVMPNFADPTSPSVPFLFPHLLGPPSAGHPFKNLKSLCIYKNAMENIDPFDLLSVDELSSDSVSGYPIAPFLPFLNLPTLNYLGASNACQSRNTFHYNYPVCERTSSKLQNLVLQQCSLAPEVLEHLVSRCAGLQRFTCEFAEDTYETTDFSWDAVGRVLLSQRHSLQGLELDCENMSRLAFENTLDPSQPKGSLVPIGSLEDFPSLTYVYARQVVLIGVEECYEDGITPTRDILRLARMLPPNLEHLTIENCTLFAVPHLEEILAGHPIIFPRLKCISAEPIDLYLGDLDRPAGQDKVNLNRIVRLRAGFRDAGIDWVSAPTQQPEDEDI